MGGLIGTANNTKDGLMSKYKAPFNFDDFAGKYLRIEKREGLSFFLEFFGSSVSSNLYFVSINQDKSPMCSIKKIAILVSGNALSGKQDSQYIYLTKPWGTTMKTSIIPVQGRNVISCDIVTELPSDVTDIQIID